MIIEKNNKERERGGEEGEGRNASTLTSFTPILASVLISYHFESKAHRHCPMAATSILKIIRNFHLVGAR